MAELGLDNQLSESCADTFESDIVSDDGTDDATTTSRRPRTSKYFVKSRARQRYRVRVSDPKQKFELYRRSAARRGLEFSLDYDLAVVLFSSPCHYCGRPPGVAETAGLLSGIDRLNNDRGYGDHNVVACCGRCNRAKHTMTVNAFVTMCTEVAQHVEHLRPK
ncbi:Hypothetical protein UVM_LOCUS264 [uncultured virus]|nr:Hypothetical protein UVM_LOCUS264 [uncultured virus]